MNRKRNAKRNLIWLFLNKFISILLPFLTRTVFIWTLGTTYLGLGSLFSSVLSMLSLAELGFSSAITFSMYKPIAEENYEQVCKYLNFYKKCYRVIGSVVLVIGLLLVPFLDELISGEVPTDINIYLLYLVYLCNSVLGYFLFAYKKSLLVAYQRNDINTKITTFVMIIQNVLQIVLLFFTRNFYCYVLVLPVITASGNIITNCITKKMYPKIYPAGRIGSEDMQAVVKKVKGLIFQKIGIVVNNSVDNVVISAFLGLEMIGIYGNYYYIFLAISGICAAMIDTLVPTIGNSVAVESKEKNYKDFYKCNFLYMWGIIWCSVCLLCLYQPFMKLWVGESLMLPSETIVLFAIYFFTFRMNNISGMYKQAAGIWWEGKFVPLIAACVNLLTNIILVQIIGLNGIILSTILSMTLVYFPYGSYVLFKNYFTYKGAWRKYMLKQLLYFGEFIIVAVITYNVCLLMVWDSVLDIIYRAVVCLIVPNVVFVILNMKDTLLKECIGIVKKLIVNQNVVD